MDFTSRSSVIRQARALYDQARLAAKAEEETAAFELLNACIQAVRAGYETTDLDLEEIAEILEVGIGELAEFSEQLAGAAVRQKFMKAVEWQREPDKALQMLHEIEQMYLDSADEDVSFDEFCHEAGIDPREYKPLVADVTRRAERSHEWQSGGEQLLNIVVGASLRQAFRWAARTAPEHPGRALKILNAIDWVARKMDGSQEAAFYDRTGIDGNLIRRMKSDIALKI